MILPNSVRSLLLFVLFLSPLRALDTVAPDFNPLIRGPGSVNEMAWHPESSMLYAYVSGEKLNGQPLASQLVRFRADGTWDAGYAPSIVGAVSKIIMLPDGKILLAGNLTSVNAHTSLRVARLMSDGSVDTSFTTSGGTIPTGVREAAVGGDGSIYLGMIGVARSQYTNVNGTFKHVINWPNLLYKLGPDGVLDTAFSPVFSMAEATASIGYRQDMFVESLLVTSTGDVIAGGNFTMVDSTGRAALAKLGSNGVLDTTYAPVLGYVSDSPFDPYPPTVRVTILADAGGGQHYAGGIFNRVNGDTHKSVARLDGSGTADPTFQPQLEQEYFSFQQMALTDLQLDGVGRIVMSGNFRTVNGVDRKGSARVDASGTLDPSFEAQSGTFGDRFILLPVDRVLFMRTGISSAGGIIQPAVYGPLAGTDPNPPFQIDLRTKRSPDFLVPRPGKGPLVGSIWMTEVDDVETGSLAALTPEGNLDLSFHPDLYPKGGVECGLVLPDGRVLVGGSFVTAGGLSRPRLALLEPDGSPVADFDLGSGPNTTVDVLRLMPSGKVLAAGNFSTIDGEKAPGLALLDLKALSSTQGLIVEEILEARYGTDSLFTDVRAILNGSLNNGKLEMDITNTSMGGDPAPGVPKSLSMRFRSNRGERSITIETGTHLRLPSAAWDSGLLDRHFRPANTETLFPKDAAGQPDGKILVVGSFSKFAGHGIPDMVRLHPDGSVDTDFQPASQFFIFSPEAVEVSASGQIYIGDLILSLNGSSVSRGVYRLHSSGTNDSSFVCPSFINWVYDIKIHPDGSLWCAGRFGSTSTGERKDVARLLSNGSVDTRFDAGNAANSFINGLALEAPGKLWMNGSFSTFQDQPREGLALINLASPVKPVAQMVPKSLVVTDGTPATFGLTEAGADETYVWRRDGLLIPGANGSSLTVTSGVPVGIQTYTAQVTNAEGTTSSSGTLTVREATLSEWLAFRGLNGLLANADSDGDGTSNVAEYLARTDPGDGTSVFATGIELHTGSVRLTWNTYPGRQYRVEKSPDLRTWLPTGPLVTGTGEEKAMDVTYGPEETAFYWRVTVSKP